MSEMLPEVQQFLEAEKELTQFKENHREFYEELQELLLFYNRALEMAEKAVRAKGINCGPFVMISKPRVSYDAEKVFEELGAEFFFRHGGTTIQVTEYRVDKARLEAAWAANKIPKDSDIRKVVYPYKKIKPAELP